MNNRFLSRKFLLAVIGGLVVFLNGAYDLGLKVEEVTSIVVLFLGFIGVEGYRDIKETK